MKKAMHTGSFGSEADITKEFFSKSRLEPIRANRMPEFELSIEARELVDLLVEVALRTQVDILKSDEKKELK